MDKFELKRAEIRKKFEEEMARLEDERKSHEVKVVKPLASKFSAILAEEIERLGSEDFTKVEAYKFNKAIVRNALREFLLSEFGKAQSVEDIREA